MSIEQGFIEPKKEKLRFTNILVYRVRHPDTEYKEQTTFGGITDDTLDITEKGKLQMEEALKRLVERLTATKDSDLIWIASSPRKRTRDGASLIKEGLVAQGFSVVESEMLGEKGSRRTIQPRVRNFDFFDANETSLETSNPQFAEVFNAFMVKLKDTSTRAGSGEQQYLKAHPEEFPEVEDSESVQKRVRNQLTFLSRIAKTIQPEIEKKLEKRLVIIQVEHTESLEDFYHNASMGEFTVEKNKGPEKGEVVEITIPVDRKNDTLQVSFLDRESSSRTIRYDHVARKFIKDE